MIWNRKLGNKKKKEKLIGTFGRKVILDIICGHIISNILFDTKIGNIRNIVKALEFFLILRWCYEIDEIGICMAISEILLLRSYVLSYA